jgi:hypothetical protein
VSVPGHDPRAFPSIRRGEALSHERVEEGRFARLDAARDGNPERLLETRGNLEDGGLAVGPLGDVKRVNGNAPNPGGQVLRADLHVHPKG